jgi:hypothetical protein
MEYEYFVPSRVNLGQFELSSFGRDGLPAHEAQLFPCPLLQARVSSPAFEIFSFGASERPYMRCPEVFLAVENVHSAG